MPDSRSVTAFERSYFRKAARRSLAFAGVVGAGAVLFAVVFVIGVSIFLWFTRPARIDPGVYRPLPEGMHEILVDESGCNPAGPEPEYLVYHSVVVVDESQDDPVSAVRQHLTNEGWRLSQDVGFYEWGAFSGEHERTTVVVGPARSLIAWGDVIGDPGSYVSGLLTGEYGDERLVSREALDRAVALRFDLAGDWSYC